MGTCMRTDCRATVPHPEQRTVSIDSQPAMSKPGICTSKQQSALWSHCCSRAYLPSSVSSSRNKATVSMISAVLGPRLSPASNR